MSKGRVQGQAHSCSTLPFPRGAERAEEGSIFLHLTHSRSLFRSSSPTERTSRIDPLSPRNSQPIPTSPRGNQYAVVSQGLYSALSFPQNYPVSVLMNWKQKPIQTRQWLIRAHNVFWALILHFCKIPLFHGFDSFFRKRLKIFSENFVFYYRSGKMNWRNIQQRSRPINWNLPATTNLKKNEKKKKNYDFDMRDRPRRRNKENA